MFFLFFILVFCFLLPSPAFAAAVPPVIPDSVNTNELYSGSFDLQYPNKEFVPNKPKSDDVVCTYTISDQKDLGSTAPNPPNEITIDKPLKNQNVDQGNRFLGFALYNLDPLPVEDPATLERCRQNRFNSMDSENPCGASSAVQRMLPQKNKDEILCSRFKSGILNPSDNVIDTDEKLGCYCGGNDYRTTGADCSSGCRTIYFSELAFYQNACAVPALINSYYNCDSGSCPYFKRDPNAKAMGFNKLPSELGKNLFLNASTVGKGSIGTVVRQVDTNKESVGVLPFLMAPSTKQSDTTIRYAFPASSQPKFSNSNCSPVQGVASKDEYHFDLIAAIKAFLDNLTYKGEAQIKQSFSAETLEGANTAGSLTTLLPKKELDKSPQIASDYSVTSSQNETILNPGVKAASNVELFRQNLTPASWQHL